MVRISQLKQEHLFSLAVSQCRSSKEVAANVEITKSNPQRNAATWQSYGGDSVAMTRWESEKTEALLHRSFQVETKYPEVVGKKKKFRENREKESSWGLIRLARGWFERVRLEVSDRA